MIIEVTKFEGGNPMSLNYHIIVQRIRNYRRRRNLSQNDVAEKINKLWGRDKKKDEKEDEKKQEEPSRV